MTKRAAPGRERYWLDVEIPFGARVNSADRIHWRTRHHEKQVARDEVLLAVRGRRPLRPLEHALVRITRRAPGTAPDPDNLASGGKHVLDALVFAGVLADDRPAVIGRPQFRAEGARERSTRIEILEVELGTHERIAEELDAILARHWGDPLE